MVTTQTDNAAYFSQKICRSSLDLSDRFLNIKRITSYVACICHLQFCKRFGIIGRMILSSEVP